MVLENFFPTATGAILRRGCQLHTMTEAGERVESLFTYVSGNQKQLFAATASKIFNISSAVSTEVASGKSNGDWVFVQFSTAGGSFLIGVNGQDPAILYNGTTWSAPSITFPAGNSLTTASLSYVWSYQKRLYFIEKDTLNVWYLPVDQIGGELTVFPMGPVFPRGGALLWGQTWSLDSGGAGGLSGQCVFTSTEGEVAAFQGIDPNSASTWAHVGTYRIGRPLGKKALIRAGGDLVIATTVGFVSLSSASRSDYAALGRGAVSYPIEDEWARAVAERGEQDWRCQVWADGQMIFVSPPAVDPYPPVLFVSNSNTGAWCKFTGWDAISLESFQGRLYFGSPDGGVRQGNVTGADEGMPYTGRFMPLFSDCRAPASRKIARMARALIRAGFKPTDKLTARFDFDLTFPPPPDQVQGSAEGLWETGTWEESVWNADRFSVVEAGWRSVGGSGQDVSLSYQVTSGGVTPIDVEIVRLDLTIETADIVS